MKQFNIVTRFIGVISGKGGVGKTTFVSNVSTILSQHFGRDVTVIDCNADLTVEEFVKLL
jgi:MinD-like ATPase involved in chromosome partitioning or flagellar assembly